MMRGVEVCSVEPSAVWIDPTRLGARMDASYFSASHVKLDDVIEAHKDPPRLGQLLKDPRRVLYMNTETFDQGHTPDGGVPFVSGVDLDETTGAIRWEQVKCVEPWMAERYPKGLIFSGALLIKVKGPNQLATYVEHPPYQALVSGTFVLSGVRDVDPYFLSVYLTSPYAQSWRTRLRQNITVEFTPYDELAEIPVVRPSPEIQQAIGNKVRKAERLREFAQNDWSAAAARLSSALDVSLTPATFECFESAHLRSTGYNCRLVDPPVVFAAVENELGAQYYHPRRIRARLVASSLGHWDVLSAVAKRVRGQVVSAGHEFVGLDRIDSSAGVIRADGEIDPTESAAVSFEEDDILFSRLRPYLNKVTIWPRGRGRGSGSGELLVYRSKSNIDPYYLFFILKSALGTYQVLDVTSGSTHPRVDSKVVDEIRIPRLGDDAEGAIAIAALGAFARWYEAQNLIPAATAAVQSLIDGTLDESALLAEGEAIERWLQANPSPSERN